MGRVYCYILQEIHEVAAMPAQADRSNPAGRDRSIADERPLLWGAKSASQNSGEVATHQHVCCSIPGLVLSAFVVCSASFKSLVKSRYVHIL